jgi:hypothetical protein
VHPPGPWEQMTNTYSWVVEQEILHRPKASRKPTEEWVLKQQIYFPEEEDLCSRRYMPSRSSSMRREVPPRRTWEEVVYRYEIDAERWMRHEAEVRRLAEERQRAQARIQEEIRRIDERIQQRRAAEKRLIEEYRMQGWATMRERERRERRRMEKVVLESWEKYEARWAELGASTELLSFRNIPWPLISPPKSIEDITPAAIQTFLLSPAHSQTTSSKDRLRSAQLRWHPDRFRRLHNRIEESEKAMIEEGAGVVARCLNELMEREKSKL